MEEQYTTMIPQRQNPYEGLADVPINEPSFSQIDRWLSTQNFPKEVKDDFAHIFSDDIVLGFNDKETKRTLMDYFDIVKIDHLSNVRRSQYTWDMEKKYSMMRMLLEIRIQRSIGVNNPNQKNERILEAMSLSESRNISQEEGAFAKNSGGIFSNLFGMLGRKR